MTSQVGQIAVTKGLAALCSAAHDLVEGTH